ncbi:MAG TPA: HAMP domain-containing protein [Rhodospirillales bacterium]|nr:HAMP domain-containing protein [Rhodospirillales bacterium]
MAKEKVVKQTLPIEEQSAGSRTFLSGIRLNSRVILFVVIGILSLAAMGGVFFNAEQRLRIALDSLTSSYHIANLSFRVETAILALNSDSQNFLISKKTIYAENYSKRSSEAAILLTNLQRLPAASNGQMMLKTLIESVTKHATYFQNTLQIQSLIGTSKDKGLLAKTAISGTKLQTQISATRNSKLVNEINALRKSEIKLQEPTSPEDAQNIMRAVKNIRQSLIASRLSSSVKRVINNRITPYASDLEGLAQTRLGQIREIARMGEVNIILGQNLKALVTFTRTLSKSARKNFETKQTEIRNIVAGGSAFIIVLFTLVGTILMRSIVRPVKYLAKAAMQLARGDESVTIPAIENQDETGEVAIALTYFRENMIEANTLRKELEYYLRDADQRNEYQNQESLTVEETAEQTTPEDDVTAELNVGTLSDLPILNSDATPPEPSQKLRETEVLEDTPLDLRVTQQNQDERDGTLQSTPISEASQLVAQTSQSASSAARDAERCDVMINGLSGALKKIKDIELLLESINDHMSLLAVQTAITNETGSDDPDEVISRPKSPSDGNQRQNPNEFVTDNLDTLQNGTKRAIRAIRQVGQTIQEVNQVALEIATEASNDALDAATMLLHQSEHLRGMLDGLLEKIKPSDVNEPNS